MKTYYKKIIEFCYNFLQMMYLAYNQTFFPTIHEYLLRSMNYSA